MKRMLLLTISLIACLLLAGCSLKSPEELYTLPKPSADYENLQSSLDALLAVGYEYAAPLSGSNTQSVQLEDLDSDGVDEAIAFFRDSSSTEHPLKICIFRMDEDGAYSLALTIEGDGDSIGSVVYCQLNSRTDSSGNPTKEIVVGWRISSTVYALSAYSIENDNVTQLMSVSGYTRYVVCDLDQDNLSELVVLQIDTSEEGFSTAGYYDWSEEGLMTLVNSATLSGVMESLYAVQTGYLTENYPAVYITGNTAGSYLITDILTLNQGMLVNLTLSDDTGSSTAHLSTADVQDINGDNVLEIPITTSLKSSDLLSRSDSFSVIRWVQFTQTGQTRYVAYTYHNTTDGWYFTLPASWVDHLILSRSDSNVGATVEKSITFYYLSDEDATPEAFLTIYKNTGTNRVARSVLGSRFLLLDDGEACYSAELHTGNWDSGLTEASVAERFALILTVWSTE